MYSNKMKLGKIKKRLSEQFETRLTYKTKDDLYNLYAILDSKKESIKEDGEFNSWMANPEYSKILLQQEGIKLTLKKQFNETFNPDQVDECWIDQMQSPMGQNPIVFKSLGNIEGQEKDTQTLQMLGHIESLLGAIKAKLAHSQPETPEHFYLESMALKLREKLVYLYETRIKKKELANTIQELSRWAKPQDKFIIETMVSCSRSQLNENLGDKIRAMMARIKTTAPGDEQLKGKLKSEVASNATPQAQRLARVSMGRGRQAMLAAAAVIMLANSMGAHTAQAQDVVLRSLQSIESATPTEIKPELAQPTEVKPQLAQPTDVQAAKPQEINPILRTPTTVQPAKLSNFRM